MCPFSLSLTGLFELFFISRRPTFSVSDSMAAFLTAENLADQQVSDSRIMSAMDKFPSYSKTQKTDEKSKPVL